MFFKELEGVRNIIDEVFDLEGFVEWEFRVYEGWRVFEGV